MGAGPRPGRWGHWRGGATGVGPLVVGGPRRMGRVWVCLVVGGPRLTRPYLRFLAWKRGSVGGLGSRKRLKPLHVPRTLLPHGCFSLCYHFYLYFFILPPLRGTSQDITGTRYSILDQIQENQMVGDRGNDLQTQIQFTGGKIDAEREENTCPSSCFEEKDFMRPQNVETLKLGPTASQR